MKLVKMDDPLTLLANAACKQRKICKSKKHCTLHDCDPLAVRAAAAEPGRSETSLAKLFGVQNKAMKKFMEVHGICVTNPNNRAIAFRKSKRPS